MSSRPLVVIIALAGALAACGNGTPVEETPVEEAVAEEAVAEGAATEEVAVEEASLAERFKGEWAINLSESDRAELETAKAALEANPSDPMLMMAITLTKLTMTVTDDQMTVGVMGHGQTIPYTAEEKDGVLVLATQFRKRGVLQDETITVAFPADGSILMTKSNEPEPISWIRK